MIEPEVATRARAHLSTVEQALNAVIVGQEAVVAQVLVALVAGGHTLLEGVPGLGKTLLVRTLGQVTGLSFGRVQFTPDLMPGDITGAEVFDRTTGDLRFSPGPIFTNLLLADEINRATPRTQSALLEAMQEHTVTAGGQTHPLPEPFFVLATQNPLEMEGTYPLPEAQLDRFLLKVLVPFPSNDVLARIGEQTTGPSSKTPDQALEADDLRAMMATAREVIVAPHVMDYAVKLVSATHPDRSPLPEVSRYVRFGSSPRGLQALLLSAKVVALRAGRWNLAFEDLHQVAVPALRHRLILHFEATADGVTADDLVRKIVEHWRATDEAGAQPRLDAFERAMSDFPGWSRGLQAALDRLSIAAARAPRGQLAGPVLSRSLGRALEFADYRAYVAGDDPKLVDWRAYNRLDRLYLKQFREERARTIGLLIDGSASLDWSDGDQHKGLYARRLAAALAWIALGHLERIQAFVLRGETAQALPSPAVRSGAAGLFSALAAVHEEGGLSIKASIGHALGQLRGEGPIFLLTDLLDADWPAALQLLARRQQHDVVVQLLAPDEWHPPLGDEIELQDSESGELRQTRFGPSERAAYRARLDAFLHEIEDTSRRLGLRHLALDTATPLADTLLKALPAAGILQ